MDVLMTLLFEGAADSSFVRLFTEMNAWTIVLFVLGIIFCAIEMCIPGFGFFGISGIVMIVAGIIVRMVCGGDLEMLLYMILIALVLLVLMLVVFSRLITKGKLGKSAIFNVGTAVPEDKTEGTKHYDHLLGVSGKVINDLRPVGKADFDGEIVEVVAQGSFIETGSTVTVISCEGGKVVVSNNNK